MAQVTQWVGAVVVFAAELAAVGALGYWGWATGGSGAGRWVLALGLPPVAAVLWGLFAAPQAAVQVGVLAVVTKVVVFGAAVAALFGLGSPRLAVALALAAVVGSVLAGPLASQTAEPVVSSPAPR